MVTRKILKSLDVVSVLLLRVYCTRHTYLNYSPTQLYIRIFRYKYLGVLDDRPRYFWQHATVMDTHT